MVSWMHHCHRPQAIVHRTVPGTSGQQFWLFPKQAWNNCIITYRTFRFSSLENSLVYVSNKMINACCHYYYHIYNLKHSHNEMNDSMWSPLSEFVSSSILSWQILTAHAQPFREARDLAFYLKVPLDSLLVWASSGGSGETARMHRLAWTFAARIADKYQIRLTRPILKNIVLLTDFMKNPQTNKQTKY